MPIVYRGFELSHCPYGIEYYHPNYDGADDAGASRMLAGVESDMTVAKRQVDEVILTLEEEGHGDIL